MGYYTRYDISNNEQEVIDALTEKSEYSFSNGVSDSIKWYDHEKHCKELSVLFPDNVIEVSGEGEESGDIWMKYFKNGKCQICEAEIKFEPFDESKLV